MIQIVTRSACRHSCTCTGSYWWKGCTISAIHWYRLTERWLCVNVIQSINIKKWLLHILRRPYYESLHQSHKHFISSFFQVEFKNLIRQGYLTLIQVTANNFLFFLCLFCGLPNSKKNRNFPKIFKLDKAESRHLNNFNYKIYSTWSNLRLQWIIS